MDTAHHGSEDGPLVARSRAGERPAFRALYERHVGAVHGVLVSRVAPQDADDLVQDVFVAAWRGLSSLRDDDHVGAWLMGIARNLARRHHARARPTPLPLADPAVEALVDGPAGRAADEHAAGEILDQIRALPEAYRETLVLRLVEGLTGPEIAAATGLTHGSVRVNLSRGMKLLRDVLRKEGWP